MDKFRKLIINFIIPLLILVVGIFLFKKIKSLKKQPQKVKIEKRYPIVKTKNFKKISKTITIKENGTVYYPDTVAIVPRVSGNIIKISNNLFIGGIVKKGELLAVIEPTDYILNIEAAKAEVTNRENLLKKEEENSKIAKREWEIYKKNHPNAKASDLRLGILQVNSAKAALKAAKANLKRAELNLQRTRIRAPFDAKVIFKGISKGQFVGPGFVMAKLQSIEKAYAKIYIKDENLKFTDLFENNPKIEIYFDLKGKKVKKEAQIISYSSQLDPKTKMLEVTAEIKNPLKNKSEPLLAGTYITAEIKGKTVDNVFEVDEDIIHNSSVFIYDNGVLKIKKIEYVKRENKVSLIRGISENDKVIINYIPNAVNNMKLRLADKK